jgi:hypothetical protein
MRSNQTWPSACSYHAFQMEQPRRRGEESLDAYNAEYIDCHVGVRSSARRPSRSTSTSLRLVEIIDDVLPFENAVRARGEAIEEFLPQQHGKEAAEDVTADGRIGLVEDRSRGEQRLGSTNTAS